MMNFTQEQVDFLKEKSKELEKKVLSGDLLKRPKGLKGDTMSETIMNLTGVMFVDEFTKQLLEGLEIE